MKEKIKVLLAEDELTLAMIIKDTLEEDDFILTIAANGEEGLRMFFDIRPDVLSGKVPVFVYRSGGYVLPFQSHPCGASLHRPPARSAINDVVEGFELGANDYLKKPFGMQELIIRIKALVGKAFSFNEEKKTTTRFEIGNYLFDSLAQTLTHAGLKQELSHRESEILKRLCENQNQVVNTQNVLLDLWGDDNFFNSRSLHVFITKLRHKLSADERIRIVNVRGIGYKLILN